MGCVYNLALMSFSVFFGLSIGLFTVTCFPSFSVFFSFSCRFPVSVRICSFDVLLSPSLCRIVVHILYTFIWACNVY